MGREAWEGRDAAGGAGRAAERVRRERVWRVRHPGEWAEWVRVRPLLDPVGDGGADCPFDFDDFLAEVGGRPSAAHAVARRDAARPYQPGNLTWAVAPAASPYLDVAQAAAYLGVAVQTVYNNRKHIPSLPGFRTLRFDPKILDELRASARFLSDRVAGQRRSRRASV